MVLRFVSQSFLYK
uniref:Uncharacterized protein n=1 Tax=Anguilla anguilla TaxID=7936 RepID=A0A0E9VTN5_ANGAN